MKTFTIHKYTDLMQDVYSSLDLEIFPLSSLFLTFFFLLLLLFLIYYEKSLQRASVPIRKADLCLGVLLSVNSHSHRS